jgi:hypothetical protein
MFLGFSPLGAEAEDDFLEDFAHKWQSRATKTQASQPKWAVPMISPFPQLAQVYRTDMTRQITPSGDVNWNFGSGKGFNLIPYYNTQVDILPPGYVVHGDGGQDGIGDTTLLVKYRFASANEQHGNYIVSGALAWTLPTGSHKNGAASAVLTPTLLTGKGFGRLALMSSLGGGLPTSQTATSGRTIQWNTVAQYHVKKYFFPELELNSTSYVGGSRDGKTQMFLSPGILFGKFAFKPEDPKSRIGMVAGVAFQTAVTSFHTYNHAGVVSVRFAF